MSPYRTLGNGLACSNMNNAQNRSAIQLGQPTPPWGSISTDQLGYDGAGRLIGKRYFSGTSVMIGLASAYDKSSDKLFERPLHVESRAAFYDSYDSMNRLLDYERGTLASGGGSIGAPIGLPGTNQEQAYNLDGLGNWSTTTITPEGGSSAVQSRTHNKLNEVTAYGVSPASTPVLYDHGNNSGPTASRGNGNIVDDGVRTYAYDALNRLTTVSRKSDGAAIGQYVYDAGGRRIQKIVSNGGLSGTVANGTFRYLYDGQQIVEELNASNSTTRQFIWGQYIDELIQMKTNVSTGSQPLPAGVYYLLSDLLYRSSALTNSSGAVVEAYDTDAYGNTIIFSGPGADNTWFTNDDVASLQPACETIFTGREYDPESQIYFYRARYYHPMLGRFVSRDPLNFAEGPNLYQYVRTNPAIYVDPNGTTQDPPCGCCKVQKYFIPERELFGPYYGNWCGGNWSGGQIPSRHGGQMGTAPPIDSLDACCKRHDFCYDRCAKQHPPDASCIPNCNVNLVICTQALDKECCKWKKPPPAGCKCKVAQKMIDDINDWWGGL
jgi:RHS repeat-associated protein